MSTLNFSPLTTTFPTIPIPTFPHLVLDIEDNTHLWSGSSSCWAESCDWGRLPAIFGKGTITVQFDLFVYSGKVYLA